MDRMAKSSDEGIPSIPPWQLIGPTRIFASVAALCRHAPLAEAKMSQAENVIAVFRRVSPQAAPDGIQLFYKVVWRFHHLRHRLFGDLGSNPSWR